MNKRRSNVQGLEAAWDAVDRVPGWFPYPDAYVLWLINEFQRQQSVTGPILEIGTYQGRSTALLGYFLRGDEELEVCDLFGMEAPTEVNTNENVAQYSDLNRNRFEENYRQIHGEVPIIHAVPSSELASRLENDSFRLIHIDGSHLYEPVLSDLQLSQELLGENGLVVLDDWSHSEHPEVAAAIWSRVGPEGLVPLVVTDMKMYATWSGRFSSGQVEKFWLYLKETKDFQSSMHDAGGCEFLRLRLEGWTLDDSRSL